MQEGRKWKEEKVKAAVASNRNTIWSARQTKEKSKKRKKGRSRESRERRREGEARNEMCKVEKHNDSLQAHVGG